MDSETADASTGIDFDELDDAELLQVCAGQDILGPIIGQAESIIFPPGP
jgi:hypothetical protein